jgi:hypothetical protein
MECDGVHACRSWELTGRRAHCGINDDGDGVREVAVCELWVSWLCVYEFEGRGKYCRA